MPEAPEPEITPELDEVHQQEHVPEAAVPAVPVHVDGPVRVQQLPTRVAAMRTVPIDTTAQPIAGKDRRRSSITLLSPDQTFHVALTQSDAQAMAGMDWPSGVPLRLTHCLGVYVRAKTAAGSLSFVIEQWAD